MKKSYHKVFKYIVKLESRIAFYPTVIGLMGLIFAIFMYYLEDLDISKYLQEHAPWLVINNVETARAILTTFVAGLISIMVFSFSMVMILLSQASSNYSPRVLPGLISNRRHQIVLGVYLSCLLYCIFTLVAIEPTGDKYQLPGFSVLLAIFFMTLCLAAFIYFIHSISQGIQVNNIILNIFQKAKERLKKVLDDERQAKKEFPKTEDWFVIKSESSGYLEDIILDKIRDILNEEGEKGDVLVYKGQYVRNNTPLISTKSLISKEAKDKMVETFQLSRMELIENNYVLAFKQITEIAVKAMSPGINDPGTAINCIDYLTDLFLMRMEKDDVDFFRNSAGESIIRLHIIKFHSILQYVMASLRTYCKHDVVVVRSLTEMLNNMLDHPSPKNNAYKNVVLEEIHKLHADAKRSIENNADKEILQERILEIVGRE